MLWMGNPCGNSNAVQTAMAARRIGYVDTPAQGNVRPPGVIWIADNGCFGRGYPGDAAWLAWLAANAADAGSCLFATAPDVVGDAEATLARSLPHLPSIRALGYPAALVAQDGLEHLTVPWPAFDALFIGGTTLWKMSPAAAHLIAQAKARGKHVHMGRVNTWNRLLYAHTLGCDSTDGTTLARGPDKNLRYMLNWLERLPIAEGAALEV